MVSTVTLEANKVPKAPNVYLIGGLARRVNVSSQQNRAFATILDIDDTLRDRGESRCLADCTVAIVGGGAGGLTAAATAAYLGATVFLFHKDSLLGGAHKDSEHRFLHPNFNSWPYEEENPVSNLPFLNWTTDTGKSVTTQILDGWEIVSNENGARINEPFRHTELRELILEDNKWRLDFESTLDQELPLFDHVVLCMGFGEDRHRFMRVDGPSYWNTTEHKNFYNLSRTDFRDQKLDSDACLNVFGNGDGGINECLQFVYKDFLPGDPSPNLITFLRDSGIRDKIKKIEVESDRIMRDLDADSTSKRRVGLEKLGQDIWWKYINALKGLDGLPHFKACFGSNNRNSVSKVRLFGRSKSPFDMNATAINRTMLCLAIKTGAVEYHQIVKPKPGRAGSNKKIDVKSSRNGWQKKQSMKSSEIVFEKDEFFCARFGAASVYDSIRINGKPVPTDAVRRQHVQLVEHERHRSASHIEETLKERKSRFQKKHTAIYHAKSLAPSIQRRFSSGFDEIYLEPKRDENGEPIFLLNYKFSERLRDSEKSNWEMMLPTKILDFEVKHMDLDWAEQLD